MIVYITVAYGIFLGLYVIHIRNQGGRPHLAAALRRVRCHRPKDPDRLN